MHALLPHTLVGCKQAVQAQVQQTVVFADMPTGTKEQVEAAARSVQGKGVDIVLAKLGTKGSMLIEKDKILNQDILKADKVCCMHSCSTLHISALLVNKPFRRLWCLSESAAQIIFC